MTLSLLNEWLEKQSLAMLEAKRRGLVPQSGDWEKPYRWVTPEEADESYETVDLEYARENLSPFSVRNNKGTNAKKQLADILDSDVESVTVWHGTTLGGAKKILEEGQIRGYDMFGAGITLDPYRAYTYTRGQKSRFDLPDKDKYPVVIQFDIPKDMFQNFTPETGGLGKDEFLFNPWGAATYRSEGSVSLPDEYRNSGGEFPSHRDGDIPLIIDRDEVKFVTSEDVGIPIPDIYKSEYLEKAVSTEAIASAKSRGLVPQSGDWQKPKRWVRPEDADVGSTDVTSDSTSDDYTSFLKLDHQMLVRLGALANLPGMSKKNRKNSDVKTELERAINILNDIRDNTGDLRKEHMGDLDHQKGQWLYSDWVEGMFARMVGLRAILLENEGKEISRDLVAQQMDAVNEDGEVDYEQVDFAIGFGKTMSITLNQETQEVSVQPTLDLLEAEHQFAVERTKELFGDEIEVFRCMYGDHVPELKKQLAETGELEIEEFPLTSYTHDLDAATYFCDEHMGRNYSSDKRMVFSRTIKAEEVMASWYSNPALLSGMPEQKEIVISSKEGKFIIKKDSIID